MANDLTTPLPGMAATGSVTKLLDSFQIDVYGFEDVALDRMPNAEERQLMQARMRELNAVLMPISLSATHRDRARDALKVMLTGSLPSLSTAALMEKLSILVGTEDAPGAFMLHLEDLSLLALCKGCEDITKNRVPKLDPSFAPTSRNVRDAAQGHTAPLARERDRIDRILGARKLMRAPATPEAQERVRDSLKQLADHLNVTEELRFRKISEKVGAATTAFTEANIRQQYDQIGAEPVTTSWQGQPVLVSPELLAKLGRPVKGGKNARPKSAARGRAAT